MTNEKLAIEFLKILVSQGKIELSSDKCQQITLQSQVGTKMRTTLKVSDLEGNTQVLLRAYNKIVSILEGFDKA